MSATMITKCIALNYNLCITNNLVQIWSPQSPISQLAFNA